MNTTLLLHDAYMPSEIADALSDALFILSSQKEIRACNARAKDLLHAAGAGRRKLIDLFFSELSLGDVFFKKNATPIQNRKIGIGEGTYVVRALFSGQRLVLILADLTDLRNMAQDISSYLGELSRFRMACNFLPGGIVVADPFDRIVFMNTAMREKLLARGERAEQILLSDLERIFGQFPTGEEALVLSSPALTGAPLLVEKRPLLLNGKLHGILLRFSEGGEPARSPARMAKNASVSGGDLFLPHKHDSAPATKPGRTGLSYSLANFVGQGKTVLHLKDVIRKVAASSSTVLLQSESGTGKELLAHSLHELSERANGPFIKLNCASLPESLLEAEVFGYDSGAFTGAKKSGNPGLFEQAHTGTIFLDEIGEMSLPLQAKLLRIIQEKEVQRLGGKDSKRLDVRVVCATNRNLMEFVEQGKFRSDLLFRLNVVSIAIPPLRDRKEDIKSLIIHYLREYSLHFKKRVSGVSKDVYFLFMHYEWPGNVRELGNILEYAFNIIDGATVEMKHLPQYIFESKKLSGNLSGRLEALVGEYSAQVIKKTLEQYNGNKAAAAGALGISRSKLYRLLADN